MESGAEVKVKWQTNGQTARAKLRARASRASLQLPFPSPEFMPKVVEL